VNLKAETLIIRLDPDDPYETEPERVLRNALALMREAFQPVPGLAYRGPADFVLRHGTYYPPQDANPPYNMPPRMCYGNAITMCLWHKMRYVEGYGLCHHLTDEEPPAVMHHAWNLMPHGALADVTWDSPLKPHLHRVYGLGYLGVEFSLERADHATWHKDATVLEDPENDYPLLHEPWRGETPEFNFKPSPLLQLQRSGASREHIRRWIQNYERETLLSINRPLAKEEL
jgi:hypothetical protein